MRLHAGPTSHVAFYLAFDWIEVKVMSFKIAIIGAGSVGFTKKLFTDILCVPEFKDVEFALTDMSEHNLDMIKAILDKIVSSNKLPTRVTATTNRRQAIDGARYIISCVRVGGLEA